MYMKLKLKYRFCLQLFAMALLLYSCSENETPISDTTDNQARLNFLIKTAPTNKALIHGDDGSFSSLALYIFNKADQHCEYSELIPEFTPQRLEEFSRSVNVSPQTKVIYAIANYNDPDKTFSVPVSPDLTLQQLESLTVSGNAFTDSNILMVGKKEVAINSEYVVAEVPMERLVARLDIYMFTIMDPYSNHEIEKKIAQMGAEVHRWMNLSNSVLLCPDEGTLKKLKGYLTYDLYNMSSGSISRSQY